MSLKRRLAKLESKVNAKKESKDKIIKVVKSKEELEEVKNRYKDCKNKVIIIIPSNLTE